MSNAINDQSLQRLIEQSLEKNSQSATVETVTANVIRSIAWSDLADLGRIAVATRVAAMLPFVRMFAKRPAEEAKSLEEIDNEG